MSKYKGKRIRFLARIVSLALVLAMLTESFFGSGNIVLAAEQEEIEITNGADSDNLEGVVGENADSSAGEEYNTENLDILFEVEDPFQLRLSRVIF